VFISKAASMLLPAAAGRRSRGESHQQDELSPLKKAGGVCRAATTILMSKSGSSLFLKSFSAASLCCQLEPRFLYFHSEQNRVPSTHRGT
jgi:hypothetical protein